MGRKFFAVFLFCVLLFTMIPFTASAETMPYFTYGLDKASAEPDELVELEINANKTYDTAAGFRMIIDYDDSVLSFVRTENSSQIKSGTMMTNSKINPIYSVYVCDTDQKTAPVLSGNIISFVFKVKNDAEAGKTTIGAHIDEICNYQAQDLNLTYDEDLTLNVVSEETPSDEAYLAALEPLSGRLKPEFSPDVFEYSMNVGSDVKSVEFTASAGDDGTVKINRKTLGKAGSDTAIVATVTSADKKAKVQYVVTVHRAEAPAAVGSETDEKPSAATSRSTGTKTNPLSTNNGNGYEPNTEPAKVRNSDDTQPQDMPTTTVQNNAGATGNQFQPVNAGNSDRNIYIMGNQMPAYVILLLAAGQFILIGIALSFWLKIKPKK